MENLTQEQIENWKKKIDKMSQVEMASFYRFTPPGHPIFTSILLFKYFQDKFQEKGGMTPEISKQIGW